MHPQAPRSKLQANQIIVAFYNVENLFDTINNPLKNDDDFLPGGKLRWSENRYEEKIENIARSISSIHPGQQPAIIGMAEIENRNVLRDLISQKPFQGSYDIIHFDSPDKRGIDVGLLYDTRLFQVQSRERISVRIEAEERFRTRDILYVKGTFGRGEPVHFFVNHWSSRGEGTLISMPRRIAAADQLYKKAREILEADASAKILIMGDFNDLPVSKSITVHLESRNHQNIKYNEFYNLAYIPYKKKLGSLYARGRWLMFDQILASSGMINGEGIKIKSPRLSIHFDKKLLFYDKVRSIYRPNRTYTGKKYHGGFSDHLPVYVYMNLD